MGLKNTHSRSSTGSRVAARNQARFVPPALPVKETSLSDLKEQIRSASRVKAQAEALRARAAAEFAKRAGDSLAEKTLRELLIQVS